MRLRGNSGAGRAAQVSRGNGHKITSKAFLQLFSVSLHSPSFPRTDVEHLLCAPAMAGHEDSVVGSRAGRGRALGTVRSLARRSAVDGPSFLRVDACVCSPESLGGVEGHCGLCLPVCLHLLGSRLSRFVFCLE